MRRIDREREFTVDGVAQHFTTNTIQRGTTIPQGTTLDTRYDYGTRFHGETQQVHQAIEITRIGRVIMRDTRTQELIHYLLEIIKYLMMKILVLLHSLEKKKLTQDQN